MVLGLSLAFLVVVVLGGAVLTYYTANLITDGVALARFREQAGTENVVIVRKSNDSLIGGSPRDVIYELSINDSPKLVGGRCQSSWNSPVICRLYGAGEGD